MADDTILTVVGNLVADPELRFTPGGAAVANMTIASTPRFFDRQANEWVDGETLFVRCNVWREQAENGAESLTKGTRVIAQGRLKATAWQDKKTGEKRTGWELDVDEIGPSLRFATASVQRAGQKVAGGASTTGGFAGTGGGWSKDQGSQDPWGGQPGGGGSWGAPQDNEPPF